MSRSPFTTFANNLSAAERDVLEQAVQAFNQGSLPEAERLARQVLKQHPEQPAALNILGGLSMKGGRYDEAAPLLKRAARGQPANPFIAFNLGESLRRCGQLSEAAASFGRAARLKPDFAQASARQGEILRGMGDWKAAEAAYHHALATEPQLVMALVGLALVEWRQGKLEFVAQRLHQAKQSAGERTARAATLRTIAVVLFEGGMQPEALECFSELAQFEPSASNLRMLGRALSATRVVPLRPEFRDQLLGLFERPDVNPRSLATAALMLIRLDDAFAGLLEEIQSQPDAPGQVVERNMPTVLRLLGDELFQALLVSAPIPDQAIETLLTEMRRRHLLEAAAGKLSADGVTLMSPLAHQCFLNEYVYPDSADELATVSSLKGRVHGASVDWPAAIVLACYQPLEQIVALEHLPPDVPESVISLWRQQVEEPREERRLATSLQQLGAIRNETSIAVRGQYEANPYPRWTRCHLGDPMPAKDAVRSVLPHLAPGSLPDLDSPEILIAGCGTGLETMRVVNMYRGAKIVGIDLSRASLAYGARKLSEYGVDTVELVHGDILDLANLDRQFDMIESFGVIHHMADPEGALRLLAQRLKPQGLMRIGLYSALARGAVVAARDLIAARSYASDNEGVRQARQAIMHERPCPPEFQNLLSPVSDFWTTSDCRDLLFHVEEHRFTLLQIAEMIDRMGLKFLGMELRRPADRLSFQAQFPSAASQTSLRDWHAYELRHPETFGETYCLWLRGQ